VVDLNADVPLAAIRMGQINSTAAQPRLLVETGGTNLSSLVDADFVAGFVRLRGAVAAPPPDSYIGASGIYEYAAQPSGFAPATFNVAKTFSIQPKVFVEGVSTTTTTDPVLFTGTANTTTASMTVLYNQSNSVVGATSCGTATLRANGTALVKLTIPVGGPYYIFARVTPPSSASVDVPCTTTLTTVLSPLWPSTNTTVTKWANLGGNYALTNESHSAWVETAYDTSLMTNVAFWRITANGYHSNVSNVQFGGNGAMFDWGPRVPHILNHPTASDDEISDMFISNARGASWFRWGYAAPITIRRYRMGLSKWGWGTSNWGSPSPSGAMWTLTGYASAAFTSGAIIATVSGSNVTSRFDLAQWIAISNTTAYRYYEMRQTTSVSSHMHMFLGS
jgi:hypothetical protein